MTIALLTLAGLALLLTGFLVGWGARGALKAADKQPTEAGAIVYTRPAHTAPGYWPPGPYYSPPEPVRDEEAP